MQTVNASHYITRNPTLLLANLLSISLHFRNIEMIVSNAAYQPLRYNVYMRHP